MKLQIAALALIAAASPAFAAPATFRGLQETCAAEGERSKQCPGVDPAGSRPETCCDGLVCVGVKCQQPGVCAGEGERSKECPGIDPDGTRPDTCCEGLSCNAEKKCTVGGVSTLPEPEPENPIEEEPEPETLPETTPEPSPMTSGEDSGEPTASPVMMVGASYCTFAPDYDCYESGWPACCGDDAVECPAEQPECEVMAEPMPETLPTDCGLEGAKTEQCGADAKDGRFPECCPGYICDFDMRQCVEGESKPPTPAPQCGVVGDKTEQCTADAKPGRWAECCPGLECDFVLRECIPGPPTPMPTGMPTMAVTEMDMVGTSYCTFSPDYDCYESGWPACCGDDAVECPAEQPECEMMMKEETPEPTASMTDAPTMGATEEGTTGMPTMAADDEGDATPPSAAGVLVTGFATVGAVVAPLLLL